MKIPLFDIDGTLFKTRNPIHQNAFAFAFKKVYGKNAKQIEAHPEGKTDKQIILEVLKRHGVPAEEIRKKINTAMQVMAMYFSEHENQVNPEVLPGVKELLSKLKGQNIPIGVLTGNVERIGWTKIEKAGLRDFFNFGAFGDKTEKRVELVEIARQNAEIALGKTFQTQDFVIVGDTPKDIQCAKDAGIKVIIAATGIFSFDELAKEKPDLLVQTLEDQKVFDFITS
jgi:phosphoglycolate phosphatase-like HAD superfamily hydrolase